MIFMIFSCGIVSQCIPFFLILTFKNIPKNRHCNYTAENYKVDSKLWYGFGEK